MFDLLKSAIIPEMGHSQVPEHVVVQFSETLRKASALWTYDGYGGDGAVLGTVSDIIGSPQERVAYWCLEVLLSAAGASGECR